MNKKIIIRTLENIALYMELKGDNPFKVSAFRKAAQALELDQRSLDEIEDVTKLKGIGKGTGDVITELLTDGKSSVLEELQEEVPKGLVPMLKLQGLGGKKIAKLYKELGVDSMESLKQACIDGRVQALPGFGAKSEEKILLELENFETDPGRHPIWKTEETVAFIENLLTTISEVAKFSVAGSFRRTKETSKDLDFIVATDEPAKVKEQLLAGLPVKETIASGDTKVSVAVEVVEPIDVDFRLVAPDEFATALHHFTGSKDHNVRMRQLAKAKKEKISEYGVEQEGGSMLTFESEEAFFAHFNLPFIPPTVREDGREIDRIGELPSLVSLDDIRGDLHMHTTWSDGAHSIDEMVKACRDLGYEYMVITDHSQYLKVANGLTPERLIEQNGKLREANKQHDGIEVLSGTEMDILPDGSLDFEDEVLAQLDFVIASIHSSFQQPQEQIMARILTAMKNPYVHMIAHPTGRIVGKRDGYNPDVEQILDWAKEYGKIVELNASPYRLDLAVDWLIMAQEKGVPVAINTDAHAIEGLEVMATGVRHAQKAWLKKDNVVNTWPLEKLRDFLKR
ncbi:DNA polymerase/3'-5' exonuclease PolX [Planococcus sp. CP5-4]|uniref:DNA polymerase/3'-5' exonuclease PolX n=1 Tax=unclassified Planococcus (in: firmicutes) TaxID=2662419 RepID=UPI001C23B914|nr:MULTISPECIES: DNA polymerase/3'-5' exonuclease PolX [unclassified Planococcus (in: firmicutes)]MBU9672947.1 DNA polymerase/3'-5' exonuclease PolX [Planococcus sp. CP5-4_YE]MBV0908719.1 DNA polymerase/3'-5' exonuclease PolX [Planococcus sp. CP5-4_UN]MBW6063488.1 DNA polymerase/3'-5' exonuclease PolX [Planococcus sp. CP5-4]